MAFPIRTCVLCSEEFELKPDKLGFANRCPACSTPEAEEERAQRAVPGDGLKGDAEVNAARRKAIRDMLYKKDS
jgi:hypothetical protein